MRRSKRVVAQVHLWLGLVVGLLWSIQGLTGATLVFHRELDRWAHPEWRGGDGPPLPADQLIAIAGRRAGRDITALGILDSRRDLRTASFVDANGKQDMLLLDAASGAVVGERRPQPDALSTGSTSRFIYMIHEKLVSGHMGETLIGISGVLLLSTVLFGMWMAWPRRGNWRALASPRGWRTLPQRLYSWHRLAGLVFSVVLIPVAVGGIYMTFTDPIRSGLGKLTTLNKPFRGAPTGSSAKWRPAQDALVEAQSLYPEAQFVRLAVPTPEKPYYAVRLRQAGEVRAWAGSTVVTIDARSGNVLDTVDAVHAPAADKLLDVQFSIHNGEVGGLAGRLLIMAAGLSLPTFYISGVWLWLRKRMKKKSRPELAVA